MALKLSNSVWSYIFNLLFFWVLFMRDELIMTFSLSYILDCGWREDLFDFRRDWSRRLCFPREPWPSRLIFDYSVTVDLASRSTVFRLLVNLFYYVTEMLLFCPSFSESNISLTGTFLFFFPCKLLLWTFYYNDICNYYIPPLVLFCTLGIYTPFYKSCVTDPSWAIDLMGPFDGWMPKPKSSKVDSG